MSGNDRREWRRAAAALQGWRDDLSDPSRAGDLAALGRLAAPEDALLLPCFAELYNRACGADVVDQYRLTVLARCAFLAGRLSRFERGASFAAAMAARQGRSRPLISVVRATALFSLENVDQACATIASLLAQMGGRAAARMDPLEALRAMGDWDRERRRLALAYHRANTSLPEPA
jgi:hypothetical protein